MYVKFNVYFYFEGILKFGVVVFVLLLLLVMLVFVILLNIFCGMLKIGWFLLVRGMLNKDVIFEV